MFMENNPAKQQDLWGNIVDKKYELRDKYVEPPFSVLDTRQGSWMTRRNKWKSLGLESELGREIIGGNHFSGGFNEELYHGKEIKNDTTRRILEVGGHSIFDPVLCELMIRWFTPHERSLILDPFAGGSVRGIVATTLGHLYDGLELRAEQVESNRNQAERIFKEHGIERPNWITGDSNQTLDGLLLKSNVQERYDFMLSCPPYGDLEIYSELPEDISNMPYEQFLEVYRSIIYKSCKLLKVGALACFVVGEFRDKKGNYRGFVPDTIKAFVDAGMKYYNEMILLNVVGSASMRAETTMKNKKIVKIHQNVLVFKKE